MRNAAIRLCGSIQIELDGRAVHEQLGRGNPLMLFAYLALARGRGATRDEAASALWSDRAPVHADAALRTVLSRLRTALGPGVVEGGSALVLRLPESATLDVVDARDAVAAAARATDASHAFELARQALALTDSTFLPGCDAPWIDERRRELSDLHLEATEIAAWAALELGADLPSAEAAARRLVACERYRESGHALLMRILARRGNGAAALQAYEELRMSIPPRPTGGAGKPARCFNYSNVVHWHGCQDPVIDLLDERLAKAFSHPLRRRILEHLSEDDVASPSELADALGEPLGNVSYHVRILRELDCLELVRTEPRRGALEHFYRATVSPWLDEQQWAQLPATFRRQTLARTLSGILEAAAQAAEQGGFDRPESRVSRVALALDDAGRLEIAALLAQTREAALRIHGASAGRQAERDHGATPPIATELALLHLRQAEPN